MLPLHLDKRTILKGDNSEIVLHNHRLGLILKMKTDSATETTTNLAILVGCVPIGPLDADMGLPEKDRIQNGMRLDETFWKKREKAIERISITGRIRDGSAILLSAYRTTYVPVLFPFPGGGTGARFSAPIEFRISNGKANVSTASRMHKYKTTGDRVSDAFGAWPLRASP